MLRQGLIQSLLATAVAVCVMILFFYGISIFKLFSPVEGSSDFQILDLYARIVNERMVSYCSDKVFIVKTDNCSREDIVEMVGAINLFCPSAIGVDINFQYPSKDDSSMISVFGKCNNLVLPLILSQENAAEFSVSRQTNSFLLDFLSPEKFAVVNFQQSTRWGPIRTFRPYYNVMGDNVPDFSTRLMELANKEKLDAFINSSDQSTYINYSSRTFEVFSYNDIFNDNGTLNYDIVKQLTGKVVLLGDLENVKDVFPVPHTQSLPGVLIHAHCADTILSGRPIHVVPRWLELMLSSVVFFCFCVVWICLDCKIPKVSSIIVRVLQISFLFILYGLGVKMFMSNYYLDVSTVLLMLAMCGLFIDISSGILQTYRYIINLIRNHEA